MTHHLIDNTGLGRYELSIDGHLVHASYHKKDDVLYIDYVEAPPVLRGTGAAGRLMEIIMDTARAEKMKVVPVCGYAAAWIRKHSAYHDLLKN